MGGGINLYQYCVNDPLNLRDPLGLQHDFAIPVDPDRIKNCEDMCKIALATPLNEGGGGIFCFNDMKCACVLDLSRSWIGFDLKVGQCPEIDSINMRHEQKHLPQAICRPFHDKLHRGGNDEDVVMRNECYHRRESIRDLNQVLDVASPFCTETIRKLQVMSIGWMDMSCKEIFAGDVLMEELGEKIKNALPTIDQWTGEAITKTKEAIHFFFR